MTQDKHDIICVSTYISECMVVLSMPTKKNLSIISWQEQDTVHTSTPILDQQAWMDFYSVTSLKQQSVGSRVALLGKIILIPSQPVFAFTP